MVAEGYVEPDAWTATEWDRLSAYALLSVVCGGCHLSFVFNAPMTMNIIAIHQACGARNVINDTNLADLQDHGWHRYG